MRIMKTFVFGMKRGMGWLVHLSLAHRRVKSENPRSGAHDFINHSEREMKEENLLTLAGTDFTPEDTRHT